MMTTITRSKDDGDDTYHVPATLVHTILWGVVASLLGIAGYMTAWGIADSAFKANLITRLESLERAVNAVQARVDIGILPRTEERLRAIDQSHEAIERRMDKIEELHRKQ